MVKGVWYLYLDPDLLLISNMVYIIVTWIQTSIVDVID
jgi:hypothetical protein